MRFANLMTYAAAAAALMLSPVAAAAEKWDMPMAYSATNYHSEIGAEFAAEVTAAAGGRLEIVTHPGGALFGGAEIYGAVRRGAAPIGERLISALSNDDPFYGADSIPFLASTFGDARALYDASRPLLEKKLDDAGLVFLYSVPWTPQGFYSAGEARSADDVKGIKFRAYNALTSRLAELMGMAPTKIEAAELQQAFATGAAEAMISSAATGYDRKLWEHVGYFYDISAWIPRNMVFVNKAMWEELDDDTRAVVLAAARAAEEKGWKKAEELAGWYAAQLRQNGMTVAPASGELQDAFTAAGDRLRSEWLADAGAEGEELLRRYQAAR